MRAVTALRFKRCCSSLNDATSPARLHQQFTVEHAAKLTASTRSGKVLEMSSPLRE